MADLNTEREFPGLVNALAGDYTIVRELGRGGMGVVFLARDDRLDRPVALKVLPPALASDPTVRERFLREARTAAQLSHPNIVPVYSADEAAGWAYFAMAFVDGESLGERLKALGPLPADAAVRLLRDAAWALAYAHARGVVHRDVKPDNLLLERGTDRLVVTDFGIAQAPEASRLTQTGHVMGSVHFMSPEQGAGDSLDGRSDLYSLGTVGFLLLSGRLPFDHQQSAAILVQRATRDAPSLRSVAPTVAAPIAAVIDRCLERDPSSRPPTGEALAELLVRALQDVATSDAASPSQPVLTESEANLVWRRAAQLQAEAASRLESRTREQVALARTDGRDGAGREPSGGFRVTAVQAAAEEAGISRQFVSLALAELRADTGAGQGMVVRSAEPSAIVRATLGRTPRTISISRVFDHSPRRVLAAMGMALQRAPAGLRLRETIGGHALHGGVLVFDIQGMEGYTSSGTGVAYGNYLWSWTRYQMWVKTLRAQLAPVGGDSSRCEVTLTIEPPEGRAGALWESFGFGAGGGLTGAMAGALLAKKAVLVALFGLPTALPLLAGGAVLGALGNRLLYQYAIRQSREEMRKALDEIGLEFTRAQTFGDPFGDPAGEPPRLRR
ncbi:MAG TPA: serine/threonine-protein kinase [Gemmatimonadaceae bacterium]|nr:serine/threonine-protein kinase [Gemmatimonadaceae bacterium]HPV73287.1 serine/threonine-protein kinase [Gemmatimonadaceae bacterium]